MKELPIVTVPFSPHPYQTQIIESLKRFSILICHRRFGKSTLVINLLIKWAMAAKTRPSWRACYIAPLYRQAKEIAWDYLQHYARPIPGVKFNQNELKVDFPNGSRITLLGADNPDSLRGPYWDAAIFDEYAQIRPKVYPEIIRPALVDRMGWACFIGTPQGHNHFWDLWNEHKNDQEWFCKLFKSSQTKILDPVELAQARADMTAEQYEQEFECSFEAALMGAYFGAFMQDALIEKRITELPYDPILPVHTAWDIGVDDATVIWFFQVTPAGAVKFIDYHEDNNLGLDSYIKMVKERKYIYGEHLFPHDIQAREPTTAKSRMEFVENLGLKVNVVKRVSDKADGIQAVRQILPKAWFDEKKCDRGIQALKSYRKEYSEKLSTFRDSPLHDWASHGADAMQTAALGLEKITEAAPKLTIKMPTMIHSREAGWMV